MLETTELFLILYTSLYQAECRDMQNAEPAVTRSIFKSSIPDIKYKQYMEWHDFFSY